MKNYIKILFVFVLVNNFAHSNEQEHNLKVNGKVWFKYTDITKGRSEPQRGFDIYRGFIILSKQINTNWSARLIGDFFTTVPQLHKINTRSKNDNTRIFQSFIQGKNVFLKSDNLKFGLMPNLFIARSYQFLQTRWIAMINSQQEGYIGAMQLGASYVVNLNKLSIGVQTHNSDRTHGKNLNSEAAYVAHAEYKLNEGHGLLLNYEQSSKVDQDVTSISYYFTLGNLKTMLFWLNRDYNNKNERGYGMSSLLSFNEDYHFFTRVMYGNQEYKDNISADSIITFGPYKKINKNLKMGLFYEKRDTKKYADDLDTISFAIASDF